ncbi:DNA methyltransferase [Streptacidiphilus pinicola]|uniref:DNA methyltransferase n=1 Tax=Streptacidiphilus pinicola TaxID=2219663 RepID=A0A2X0IEL7_9ACTN|nr:type ISP restriction/modification enzyme [Streptacidiphilus pinicola]RAG82967.1 DNA methyltransferase [Streptacidiphilus pinicola]
MADTGGDQTPASVGDLLPWAVRGIRAGRAWVVAADPEVLEERWRRLATADAAERAELFEPTRARTPDSAVAGLPGRRTSTWRLSRVPGVQPPLVRVRHRPLDRAWMLADRRLLDQARPELWRAESTRQRYLLLQPDGQPTPAPLTVAAELPVDPRVRVFPLHRRPDGREPNLAPGLLRFLRRAYATAVAPEDVPAWIAAVCAHADAPRDAVPLPRSAAVWAEGVALGRRVMDLHTFAHPGLRLPDGRRTFIRLPVDRQPQELAYDAEEETLVLGEGRLAPVAASAWAAEPTLREWFADRTAFRGAASGTLGALGLTAWPQRATKELIELTTTLALLAELAPRQRALAADGGPWFTRADLREAGVLPAPDSARRPASVLDRLEEGPEGQYALL